MAEIDVRGMSDLANKLHLLLEGNEVATCLGALADLVSRVAATADPEDVETVIDGFVKAVRALEPINRAMLAENDDQPAEVEQ